MLKNNKKRINDLFSRTENYKLSWIFILNICYLMATVIGSAYNLVPLSISSANDIFSKIPLIYLAFFTLFIGIKGMFIAITLDNFLYWCQILKESLWTFMWQGSLSSMITKKYSVMNSFSGTGWITFSRTSTVIPPHRSSYPTA